MIVYELWLPIVASGVATHVWSTLAWTVLPHHKPEWTKIPVEVELQDLISRQNVPAGQYMVPFAANGTEATSEEFKAKNQKCRGMLVLWSDTINMGKAIGQTFTFFMIAAFTIGYLASLALVPGTPFMKVFQFVTTAALLTHCAAHYPHGFWFRRKMSMELLDGIIQAVITGLLFATLWPAAPG